MPKKQKRQKKKNTQKKMTYDFSGKSLKEICDALFPYCEDNEELYQQKTDHLLERKIESIYAEILSSAARQSPQSVMRLYMRMWDEGYISEKNIRPSIMSVTLNSFDENMAQSCVISLTDAFRSSGYSRYFPLMSAVMAPASSGTIRALADAMNSVSRKNYEISFLFRKMSTGMKALFAIIFWSCRLIDPESISAVISEGAPMTSINLIEKLEGKDDGLSDYKAEEAEILKRAGHTKRELKTSAKSGWENPAAEKIESLQVTTGQCEKAMTPQIFERAYFRTVMQYVIEAEDLADSESKKKIINDEKAAEVLIPTAASAVYFTRPSTPTDMLNRSLEAIRKLSYSEFEPTLSAACLSELYLDSAQRIMAGALRNAVKEHSYSPEAMRKKIKTLEQEIKSVKNDLKKAERETSDARKKLAEKERETEKIKSIFEGKGKSESEKRLEKENTELYEKLRRAEKLVEAGGDEAKRLKEKNRTLEERNSLLEKMLKKEEQKIKRADTNGHYFFAVELEALEARLRIWFPNSLFSSTSDIMAINEKNIDAIVVMTTAISHGGLERVEARMGGTETPFVYCNSRNLDLICQEIAKVLKKD